MSALSVRQSSGKEDLGSEVVFWFDVAHAPLRKYLATVSPIGFFWELRPACVYGWFHVAAIETVVSQIDTFASSTGDFNIITLDHMKKLENLLSLRTPDTLTTIDLAGSQGLDGMKVDTVKPQIIVFVFPIGHGVIVFMCAQS